MLALRAAGVAAGWGFQFTAPGFVAAMAWLMLAVGLNLSGVYRHRRRGRRRRRPRGARRACWAALPPAGSRCWSRRPAPRPSWRPRSAPRWRWIPPRRWRCSSPSGSVWRRPMRCSALVAGPGAGCCRGPGPGWSGCARAWPSRCMRRRRLAGLGAGAAGRAGRRAGGAGRRRAAGLRRLGAGPGAARRLGRASAWPPRSWRLAGALALLPRIAAAPAEAAAPGPGAEAWSEARVAALRAEGRPVFVNATAAWCITCQVNERVALRSEAVQGAFAARGVAYLKARLDRAAMRRSARCCARMGATACRCTCSIRPAAARRRSCRRSSPRASCCARSTRGDRLTPRGRRRRQAVAHAGPRHRRLTRPGGTGVGTLVRHQEPAAPRGLFRPAH